MLDEKMIKHIQDLGKIIGQAKSDKARYEGGMDQIIASWKQSNGLNSVEEARALVILINQKIEEKESEVSQIYNKLTSEFTW